MKLKNYSKESQRLLAEFNALRYREDYCKYLEKLDLLARDHDLWDELQFHKVNIYLIRGEITKAENLCSWLLDRLVNPEFILRVRLIYEKLKWQTKDQSFEGVESIVKMIVNQVSTASSEWEKCILKSAQLLLEMLKIELGLRDALSKSKIIQDSKSLIGRFLEVGLDEDAFKELYKLIQFSISQPLPDQNLAVSLIKYYRDWGFVKHYTYRVCALNFVELGILLERALNGGLEAPYHRCLKSLQELYSQIDHKTGEAKLSDMIGRALLNFGNEEGVRLLHTAIDHFKNEREFSQSVNCYNILVAWFETTGQFEESAKYQTIVNNLKSDNWAGLDKQLVALKEAHELSTLGITIKSAEKMLVDGMKSDSYMRAAFAINRVNAMVANGRYKEARLFLVDEIKALNRYGLTRGIADLKKCLADTNQYYYQEKKEILFDKAESAYICAFESYELLKLDLNCAETLRELFYQRAKSMERHEWRTESALAIELEFQRALSYVEGKHTREAKKVYAQILESYAKVCIMRGDIFQAIELETDAKAIFEKYKLANPLAYNTMYLALLNFNLARKGRSLNLYEGIYTSVKSAEKLFSKINDTYNQRRALFYMALAKHEQISNCGSLSDELIKIVELHYRQSFEIVHFLIRANLPQAQGPQHAYNYSKNLQEEIHQQLFSAMLFALRDTHNPSFGLWVLEKNKSQVLLSRLLPNKEMNIHSEKKGEEPDTMEALLKNSNFLEPNQNGLIVQYWYYLDDIYLIGMHSCWSEPRSILVSQEGKKVLATVKRFFHTQGGVRRMYQNNRVKVWEECSRIISPIAEWSKPNDVVCIVPYGELNGVPLHTLKLKGQYLIERNPVHYAPSTTILSQILQKKLPNYRSEVAVFGNPTKDLLNAREEAENIAKAFSVVAILEDAIDKQVLLDAFQSSKLVHFAGHGEYKQDGMEGHLKLKDDVNLNAVEIFEKEFNNDLVVLSGCETGVQTYNIGDDMVGLTTAFLYAGSQSVVSSLWKVQDYSSSLLFKVFYDEYKQGVSKAVALQRAAKKMIANPKTEHIYHWGAFTLTGQWK
tara:strand:- start:2258 stop:5425 length:3168 start_codon:yes stop_codon:yes gene_type:complete